MTLDHGVQRASQLLSSVVPTAAVSTRGHVLLIRLCDLASPSIVSIFSFWHLSKAHIVTFQLLY